MVKVIFYIVILVLVLSFFGISLQHLVEAPATQDNFSFVWSLLMDGWDDVVQFVTNLWNGLWTTTFKY
jgi:hypothetical protein